MKKATIKIQNRKGRHPQGGPQSAEMVLRAGAKGTGRSLYKVQYWPWSGRSIDLAEEVIRQAAESQGYEIVYEEEEYA